MKNNHALILLTAGIFLGCASRQTKTVECVRITVEVIGANDQPLEGYRASIGTAHDGALADYQPLIKGRHVFVLGRYDGDGSVTLAGMAPSGNLPPTVGVACSQDVVNFSQDRKIIFRIPCAN